jgi:hypothetical protein
MSQKVLIKSGSFSKTIPAASSRDENFGIIILWSQNKVRNREIKFVTEKIVCPAPGGTVVAGPKQGRTLPFKSLDELLTALEEPAVTDP